MGRGRVAFAARLEEMEDPEKPAVRQLRLRYAAVCAECGTALAPGTDAVWNRETKTATCMTCVGLANGYRLRIRSTRFVVRRSPS
jgi:hypothetical protein